jgi:hypothetical protein
VREDIDMRTMLRILCAILSLAPTVFAADVTGTWTGTLSPDRGGGQPLVLILIQTEASIAGSGGPNQDVQYPIEKGTIKEDRVTLEVVHSNVGTCRYTTWLARVNTLKKTAVQPMLQAKEP